MTFSFSRKPLLNSVRECQHKDGVRCCYTHSPTTVWPYLASGLRVSSGDVRGPEYWTVSGSASGIRRCWCCLNPIWINTLFGFLHQMMQRTFKWLSGFGSWPASAPLNAHAAEDFVQHLFELHCHEDRLLPHTTTPALILHLSSSLYHTEILSFSLFCIFLTELLV